MVKKITKKTKLKVITVQVPKPEAPVEVEGIIDALSLLQTSVGWTIVIKILNDNIIYLEKAILEKIDPITKETLTDPEIEVLRTKRGLNIELRETPANYMKVIRDAGEMPGNYDPYYKTAKEIEDSKK